MEESMTRTTRDGLIGMALAIAAMAPAHAQYPNRTIRWIVPFAAGSGTDTVARIVQPQLAQALGEQVVIDNRPGAAGNLGAQVAASAQPDGYTIFMGISSHSISMTLYRKPGFDLSRDFLPVSMLAAGSFALATHPSLPAKTVRELAAFAKKRPGAINVATAGATIRLAAKMFDTMAGTQMTEVTYKGTPQAITAVVSGEAGVSFPATSAVIPHARAGKLRVLAVTTPRRSHMAPDIPTVAESGLPGYDVTTWYGIMVPAGTSKDIVARLNSASASALSNATVKERFATTDLEPKSSTPEEFGAYIRGEIAKWAKVIKASGIPSE
jgi:tripartite-type tricarboxylate transporter receptor subunit TctC